MTFPRITVEPDKMAGQPCIRDLRIPVATVVATVADVMTVDEILGGLPELEAEDVAEALRYAAEAVRERAHPPADVRFLVDENLSRHPALLRANGHDAEHVSGLGLESAADPVTLDMAQEDDRVLISADMDFGTCSPRAKHNLPRSS